VKRRVLLASTAVVVAAAVTLTVFLVMPPPSVDPTARPMDAPSEIAVLEGLPENVSVAAVLAGSDELLVEQHADLARPIASITKVITALVVLDAAPLADGEDGPVLVPGEVDQQTFADLYRSGSEALPVSPGAPLTQRQLLEATLVASSANHAFMLAFQAFGTIDGYRAAAHDWLMQHGFQSTSVIDPAGVSELDTSTAREMLAIGELAMANPTIAQTVSMTEVVVPGAGTYPNRNPLLGVDGVDGIKTGTTGEAGFSFMMSARLDIGDASEHVFAIVLGAESNAGRFGFATELLGAIRDGFVRVHLPAGTRVGEYDPAWSPPVDAVLREPLDVLAWRGELRPDLLRAEPTEAGALVGHVSWLAPTGEATAEVVLDSELPPPDPAWRLFGRWG